MGKDSNAASTVCLHPRMQPLALCAHGRADCLPLDLSAAVDVYGEWVDAADAVAEQTSLENRGTGGSSSRAKPSSSRYEEEDRYAGHGVGADDDYD